MPRLAVCIHRIQLSRSTNNLSRDRSATRARDLRYRKLLARKFLSHRVECRLEHRTIIPLAQVIHSRQTHTMAPPTQKPKGKLQPPYRVFAFSTSRTISAIKNQDANSDSINSILTTTRRLQAQETLRQSRRRSKGHPQGRPVAKGPQDQTLNHLPQTKDPTAQPLPKIPTKVDPS